MNTKRGIAVGKLVVKGMINFGSGFITGSIVRALVPRTGNKFVDACVYITAVAGGCALADAACKSLETRFDPILEAIEDGTLGDIFLFT
jgi:hypothetical protein